MVLKNDPLLVPPPASSSDEEMPDDENDAIQVESDEEDSEEEDSEEEEEDEDDDDDNDDDDGSSSEEDENDVPLKKLFASRASSSKNPPLSNIDSDSDEDVHEYQSVSSPDSDGFSVCPRTPNRGKGKQVEVVESPKRRSRKRPARATSERKMTTKKTKFEVDGEKGADGSKEGRALFKRVWSYEDKIALLKGLREYEKEKGKNPFYDMGGFHDFIKGRIHVEVSRKQLVNKARSLRRMYERNCRRAKDGEDPIISKSHDWKVFQVSKTVWGDGKLKNEPAKRGRPSGIGKGKVAQKPEATEVKSSPQVEEEKGRKNKEEGCKKERRGRKEEEEDGGKEENKFKEKTGGEVILSRFPYLSESVLNFPGLSTDKKNVMKTALERCPGKCKKLEKRWRDVSFQYRDICSECADLMMEQYEAMRKEMNSN